MELRLEMIHLQLTRQCNLNCWFCGQRKNSLRCCGKEDMALKTEDWLRMIDEMDMIAGRKPSIMLWGGEPLMSPCFDVMAHTLHEKGYRIGIVTNGTLLEKHVEIVSNYVDRIYVSIDGPERLHDSIRGEGTFQKIKKNLLAIRRNAPALPVTCMAVLTKELKEQLTMFYDELLKIPVDEVLLQDMITLTEWEIRDYREVMKQEFSIETSAVESWRGEKEEFTFKGVGGNYPFHVRYLPHTCAADMENPCRSPWRHLHVMWNGETSFCTDFTDFTMGNVRDQSMEKLFRGERAETFRSLVENGRIPTCRHCSWRNKGDYFEL